MNIRTTLTALAVVLGVGAAAAQSDPVKTREDLMKANNNNAKAVVQMVKGQKPFDAKVVEAAFTQWADTAKQAAEPISRQRQDRRRQSRLAENLGEQKGFRGQDSGVR